MSNRLEITAWWTTALTLIATILTMLTAWN